MPQKTATAEALVVLTGAAFALASLALSGLGSEAVLHQVAVLLAAGLVAWIAWQDAVTFTIPDGPLAALALVALAERLGGPAMAFDPALVLAEAGFDVALAGGCVLLVREVYFRRRGHDGVGFGDVKLAAVGGLLCGVSGFAVALFLASLAGLAIAIVALRRSGGGFSGKLPFGALLAPLLWGVWVLSR